MNTNSLLTVVLSAILSMSAMSATACHPTGDDDGTSDASTSDAGLNTDGGGTPTACYIAGQFRCKELPRRAPTMP